MYDLRSPDFPTQPQLPAAFAELSEMLAREEPFDATLLRVAQLLKQSNAEAVDVSVSMVNQDRVSTVVHTGAVSIDLDERQYERGSGPCLDAARTGRRVVVTSGPADRRYPEFVREARDRKVGLTVSVGLFRPGGAEAGLNVYAGLHQAADQAWLRLIGAFANYASLAVAQLAAAEAPTDRERLQQVVASRSLVDQATAALVARHHYTRDDALAELLTTSRMQHRPLAAVAASVLV